MRKLLQIGKMVIVSVPYEWPKSASDDYIHDPVDETKLAWWMDRKAQEAIAPPRRRLMQAFMPKGHVPEDKTFHHKVPPNGNI